MWKLREERQRKLETEQMNEKEKKLVAKGGLQLLNEHLMHEANIEWNKMCKWGIKNDKQTMIFVHLILHSSIDS